MSTITEVDPRQVLRSQVRVGTFEFRAAVEPGGEPSDGRTLEGYAAVFDQPTTIESYAGDFEEVVKRGAFRKTLRERTPVMQFDHGNDKRTGSTPIGAIEDLHEDDEGLFVRAGLFDNDLVEPIRQAIEGQAIRGMSFKFRVLQDRWVDADGKRVKDDELSGLLEDPGDRGPIRREITEVQLFELGPVVFPAYDQTSVGVRSESPFRRNAVALRGVIAQFGLDARCIRRHLGVFDGDARRALADEIADTFPELVEVLAQRAAPADDPEPAPTGEPETSPEPAPVATREPKPEPVQRHSDYLTEAADWYLPQPQFSTQSGR
jgi:HK97 family phage prohead protease